MKKLLMMAVIAALSSSAWAGVWTYEVDIIHMEEGTLPVGTIPAEIQLKLFDSARSKEIASASINFNQYIDYIDGNGRFMVVEFIDKNTSVEKTSITLNAVGGTLELAKDSSLGYTAKGVISLPDSSYIFPAEVTTTDQQKSYAEKNLKTMFTADEKTYTLDVEKSGAAQLGTTAMLKDVPHPVPEPTSGMLALLGVMGLMLRRRRAV